MVREIMELTLDELQQLEMLLKRLHKISIFPFYGTTTEKWIGDKIATSECKNVEKVVRRE